MEVGGGGLGFAGDGPEVVGVGAQDAQPCGQIVTVVVSADLVEADAGAAGLVIDVEQELHADGERPNQQVRAIGDAELIADADGRWTTRIWQKYSADGHVASERLDGLRDRERVLIKLRPQQLVAVGSV